jgi:hypothetical protein
MSRDVISSTYSHEVSVENLFRELGENSPIVKIMKLINQGVVLYCTQVLKQEVFREIMTKDIRTPEGWRVIIKIGDTVEVSMCRISTLLVN